MEATIIVPAHNESKVVQRLLGVVVEYRRNRSVEVIVVPNGCTDNTSEFVRSFEPEVTVVELLEGSKNKAINAGLSRAKGRVIIVVDADTELDKADLERLVDVMAPNVKYATIRGNYTYEGCTWPVRCFYRVFEYLDFQREGGNGIYAVTRDNIIERIGEYPDDVNDDTLSCWSCSPEERAYVAESTVTVHVPRNLNALRRCLSRSARRRYRMDHVFSDRVYSAQRMSRSGKVLKILRKPSLWLAYLVYLGIKWKTNQLGLRLFAANDTTWLSDRE
jgi:glycosyltransferase involved in cell wall biosynthesis